tara:strand:+ start:277 stop:804 length:528 start_codon:yes stop_codon:yes gene_type:complete
MEQLSTAQRDYNRLLAANSTDDTAFANPADLTADPFDAGTAGYVNLEIGGSGSGRTGTQAILIPVGTNAAAETGELQVFGVYKRGDTARWFHLPHFHIDFTLGAIATGNTDETYAKIITFSQNVVGAKNRTYASGEDFDGAVACVQWDPLGALGLYCNFKTGGSSAANNGYLVTW